MRRLVAFVLERRAASGAIDWKAALCELDISIPDLGRARGFMNDRS
jgi:hypothetical protein